MVNDLRDGVIRVIAAWMVKHDLEFTTIGEPKIRELISDLVEWFSDYCED